MANGFKGFSVETHVVDCWHRGEGGGGGEEEEEGGRGVSMKEEKRGRGHFLESCKYKGAWEVEKYSTFVKLTFGYWKPEASVLLCDSFLEFSYLQATKV